MASIGEARDSVQNAKKNILIARQTAQQRQQKIINAERTSKRGYKKYSSGTINRQFEIAREFGGAGFAGLGIRKYKRYAKKQRSESKRRISLASSELEGYRKQIASRESEIKSVESQIAEYDALQRDIQVARNYSNNNSYPFGESKRIRKLFSEIDQGKMALKKRGSEIQTLKAQGLTPKFSNGKLAGFESSKIGMSFNVEALGKLQPSAVPSLKKAGIIQINESKTNFKELKPEKLGGFQSLSLKESNFKGFKNVTQKGISNQISSITNKELVSLAFDSIQAPPPKFNLKTLKKAARETFLITGTPYEGGKTILKPFFFSATNLIKNIENNVTPSFLGVRVDKSKTYRNELKAKATKNPNLLIPLGEMEYRLAENVSKQLSPKFQEKVNSNELSLTEARKEFGKELETNFKKSLKMKEPEFKEALEFQKEIGYVKNRKKNQVEFISGITTAFYLPSLVLGASAIGEGMPNLIGGETTTEKILAGANMVLGATFVGSGLIKAGNEVTKADIGAVFDVKQEALIQKGIQFNLGKDTFETAQIRSFKGESFGVRNIKTIGKEINGKKKIYGEMGSIIVARDFFTQKPFILTEERLFTGKPLQFEKINGVTPSLFDVTTKKISIGKLSSGSKNKIVFKMENILGNKIERTPTFGFFKKKGNFILGSSGKIKKAEGNFIFGKGFKMFKGVKIKFPEEVTSSTKIINFKGNKEEKGFKMFKPTKIKKTKIEGTSFIGLQKETVSTSITPSLMSSKMIKKPEESFFKSSKITSSSIKTTKGFSSLFPKETFSFSKIKESQLFFQPSFNFPFKSKSIKSKLKIMQKQKNLQSQFQPQLQSQFQPQLQSQFQPQLQRQFNPQKSKQPIKEIGITPQQSSTITSSYSPKNFFGGFIMPFFPPIPLLGFEPTPRKHKKKKKVKFSLAPSFTAEVLQLKGFFPKPSKRWGLTPAQIRVIPN